jgi:hypothetical protein
VFVVSSPGIACFGGAMDEDNQTRMAEETVFYLVDDRLILFCFDHFIYNCLFSICSFIMVLVGHSWATLYAAFRWWADGTGDIVAATSLASWLLTARAFGVCARV